MAPDAKPQALSYMGLTPGMKLSDIAVEMNVEPAILGGLVVKIGSQMIDGSIRNRLEQLREAIG